MPNVRFRSGSLGPAIISGLLDVQHLVLSQSARRRERRKVKACPDSPIYQPPGHQPPLYQPGLEALLLEHAPACIVMVSGQGKVLFVNRNARDVMAQYGFELPAGAPWPDIWENPAQIRQMLTQSHTLATHLPPLRFEAALRPILPLHPAHPREGEYQRPWLEISLAPLPNVPDCLIATCHDITTRVQAAQNQDLLLREIHHRVKNSLQMIQSLLNLQARHCTDTTAAMHLTDSATRMQIVGAIHDHLYHSADVQYVDTASYLHTITAALNNSVVCPLQPRRIAIDATPLPCAAQTLQPLGLIVTELVTNALKYGEGAIHVRFNVPSDRMSRLVVEDEGGNLPPGFKPEHSKGLGMRLIRGLLHQCDARMEIEQGPGYSRFIVHLPLPTPPDHQND